MFARIVSMRMKHVRPDELTQTIERKVLPLLRKQEGFVDEITFISPDGQEAVGISFWKRKENAESYDRQGYTEVLRELSTFVNGAPQVQEYDVSNSTVHKIATRTAA